jgi:predicted ABC-type ATPase
MARRSEGESGRRVFMKIIIIAGPNGAGKTTFARRFLPAEDVSVFINADLIAQDLSPGEPEAAAIRAGRLMLEELDRRFAARDDFAFETTLSGHTYVRRIREWRDAGYYVKLMFLTLPSADVAIHRVASRVRHGGHHVAAEVIRRRFDAGMRNFLELYRYEVNAWQLHDNGGPAPRLLQFGTNE